MIMSAVEETVTTSPAELLTDATLQSEYFDNYATWSPVAQEAGSPVPSVVWPDHSVLDEIATTETTDNAATATTDNATTTTTDNATTATTTDNATTATTTDNATTETTDNGTTATTDNTTTADLSPTESSAAPPTKNNSSIDVLVAAQKPSDVPKRARPRKIRKTSRRCSSASPDACSARGEDYDGSTDEWEEVDTSGDETTTRAKKSRSLASKSTTLASCDSEQHNDGKRRAVKRKAFNYLEECESFKFQCQICDKQFKRKVPFELHVKAHSEPVPLGQKRKDTRRARVPTIHNKPPEFIKNCDGYLYDPTSTQNFLLDPHYNQLKYYQIGFDQPFVSLRKFNAGKHADVKAVRCHCCDVAFYKQADLDYHLSTGKLPKTFLRQTKKTTGVNKTSPKSKYSIKHYLTKANSNVGVVRPLKLESSSVPEVSTSTASAMRYKFSAKAAQSSRPRTSPVATISQATKAPANRAVNQTISVQNSTCTKCQLTFTSQLQLDEHMRGHVSSLSVTPGDVTRDKCITCLKGFSNYTTMTEHMKAAHDPVKCPVCGLEFQGQAEATNHLKTFHHMEKNFEHFLNVGGKDTALSESWRGMVFQNCKYCSQMIRATHVVEHLLTCIPAMAAGYAQLHKPNILRRNSSDVARVIAVSRGINDVTALGGNSATSLRVDSALTQMLNSAGSAVTQPIPVSVVGSSILPIGTQSIPSSANHQLINAPAAHLINTPASNLIGTPAGHLINTPARHLINVRAPNADAASTYPFSCGLCGSTFATQNLLWRHFDGHLMRGDFFRGPANQNVARPRTLQMHASGLRARAPRQTAVRQPRTYNLATQGSRRMRAPIVFTVSAPVLTQAKNLNTAPRPRAAGPTSAVARLQLQAAQQMRGMSPAAQNNIKKLERLLAGTSGLTSLPVTTVSQPLPNFEGRFQSGQQVASPSTAATGMSTPASQLQVTSSAIPTPILITPTTVDAETPPETPIVPPPLAVDMHFSNSGLYSSMNPQQSIAPLVIQPESIDDPVTSPLPPIATSAHAPLVILPQGADVSSTSTLPSTSLVLLGGFSASPTTPTASTCTPSLSSLSSAPIKQEKPDTSAAAIGRHGKEKIVINLTDTSPPPAPATAVATMSFACPACKLDCDSTENREIHTITCFSARKVKCQLCLLPVLSNAHRLQHLKEVHGIFLCRVCVKEYATATRVLEHEMNSNCTRYLNGVLGYGVAQTPAIDRGSPDVSAIAAQTAASVVSSFLAENNQS